MTPFFSVLTSCLFLIWAMQHLTQKKGIGFFIVAALLSIGVLLLNIKGVSVAHWINSFVTSFSIPLIGILSISIVEQTFGVRFFSERAWKTTWIFGFLASLVLYPSALGLGSIDTYSWGWASNELLATVTLITIVLLWKKNEFGVILLLTLLAFVFHFQGSINFWDYLVDPIFGAVSIIMTLRIVLVRVLRS